DEGRIELLGVFQRLDRLRAVDHDVVVVVDDLAAEGPDQPVGPGPVTDRVAQREACRRALGMQGLAELEESVRILGELLEAGCFHMALAVDHAGTGRAQRQADPAAVALGIALRYREPAAILAAEISGDAG